MNEELTTGFQSRPIPEPAENKEQKILVTLDKYEAMVGLMELFFNMVNDRTPLGTMANDFLQALGKIKKEIDEAKN